MTFASELTFGQYQYGTMTDGAAVYKTIQIGPGLGPELVTNGNPFSAVGWNLGAGWSIAGGKLIGAAATAYAYRLDVATTIALTYQIQFIVTGYASGTVKGYVGAAPVFGDIASANGTYTTNVVAGASSIEGGVLGAAFTGELTILSIRQVL